MSYLQQKANKWYTKKFLAMTIEFWIHLVLVYLDLFFRYKSGQITSRCIVFCSFSKYVFFLFRCLHTFNILNFHIFLIFSFFISWGLLDFISSVNRFLFFSGCYSSNEDVVVFRLLFLFLLSKSTMKCVHLLLHHRK